MLGLEDVPTGLVPNENVSPGGGVGVVTDALKRRVDVFRWGLVPSWAKDPSIGFRLINARAETLTEKPSFRNAFARRRCLIPAGGFYEWRQEDKIKQPYLFQLRDHQAFTFAGLWEYWQDNQGNELYSCTIITTTPNELLAEYHDRMPVIVPAQRQALWLDPAFQDAGPLLDLLEPYPPGEMDMYEVSRAVNFPRSDSPELIQPHAAKDGLKPASSAGQLLIEKFKGPVI